MLARVLALARTIADTWARWACVALGVWLLAAPAVLGYDGLASAIHRLVGPVAAGFAFVAVWGHLRALRWATLPLGVVLLLVPWPLGFGTAATFNGLVVGLAFVTLALARGPVGERYGGGWAVLWRGTTASDRDRER